MQHTLVVYDYRPLRDLVITLSQLTFLTGPDGSGKSNVLTAHRLLAHLARGGVIASLSPDGGFSWALWAGPRKE